MALLDRLKNDNSFGVFLFVFACFYQFNGDPIAPAPTSGSNFSGAVYGALNQATDGYLASSFDVAAKSRPPQPIFNRFTNILQGKPTPGGF